MTIQRHARGYLYRKSIYLDLSALLREVAPRLVYSWEEKQEIKAAVVIQKFWREYYAGVMRVKGAKMYVYGRKVKSKRATGTLRLKTQTRARSQSSAQVS